MLKQNGSFVVGRDDNSDGTTWRMNPLIIKGREDIQKSFEKHLSKSWHQIIQMRCRITSLNQRGFIISLFQPSLVNGVLNVASFFAKILNLTFGLRKMSECKSSTILNILLDERKQANVRENIDSLDVAFFLFVEQITAIQNEYSLEATETKQQFHDLHRDFWVAADAYQSDQLKKIQKQPDLDEQIALIEIFSYKQQMLFDMIRSGKYLKEKDTQEHLIALIMASQICGRHYEQLTEEISKAEQTITENFKKSNPVKSLLKQWLQDKVNASLQIEIAKLLKSTNQNILEEITAKNLTSQYILFKDYSQFQENSEQIYKANNSRVQKQLQEPCRTFETRRQLFPPYEIKRSTDFYGQPLFEEVRTKSNKTRTDFFGWRILLQLVRWKAWTANSFLTLIDNLYRGPLGIQYLFRTQPYSKGYVLDPKNGNKLSIGKRDPYIVQLKNVWRGIQRSRYCFEQKPDRGIFGKSFSRIINYVECYVFRLLVGGVIGVGVIKPSAVLVNSIVSLLLGLTSFAWIPISILTRWVYHILIWDFDSPTRNGWSCYSPLKSIFQTFQSLQLLQAVLQLGNGITQIPLSLVSFAVIHPTLSIITFLRAIINKPLSIISDTIMGMITKKIGRQPEIDTFIAWKLTGTGVARQYTYSIDSEDVKVLLRGRLELIELNEYQRRTSVKIDEPQQQFNKVTNSIFSKYGCQLQQNDFIYQEVNKLQEQLNKQVEQRQQVYPKTPSLNVKFTAEELNVVLSSCQNLVKTFVDARKMQWVFKQFEIEEENDYQQLTEKILSSLFDFDIMVPLNELDRRIVVNKTKQAKFSSVMAAIDGEGDILSLTSTFAPRRVNLNRTELFSFCDSQAIYNRVQCTNQEQFNFLQHKNPSEHCFAFSPSFYKTAKQNLADKKNN